MSEVTRSSSSDARPAKRVAVLCTTWFKGSHADVIVPRIVEGFIADGRMQSVDLEVAALYLEQAGCSDGDDAGLPFLAQHNIPRASTVGEALGAGSPGINVDGVMIIGEHGDYELNEFGQQLYPRRRLFDSAIAAMVAGGRSVPIFNDKGLSYSATDANEMVSTARRLGAPLAAGSTVPLAWRVPRGAEVPYEAPVTEAVLIGWGPLERYGFHCLEGLQAAVERRHGGESGVTRVRCFDSLAGKHAAADELIPADLVTAAFDALEIDEDARALALNSIQGVIQIDYTDGLRAHVVICEEAVRQFAVACRGADEVIAYQMWLQGDPHGHFSYLVKQFEHLVVSGRPAIPVERTQLTTSILDAAMRSWATGTEISAPELAITYRVPASIPNTANHAALPSGWTNIG